MEILKVSSKTEPEKLAGAVTGEIRNSGKVTLEAVGAGAVNQAIKSIVITRGYIAPHGFDVCCRPSFYTLEINGSEITALKILVERVEK